MAGLLLFKWILCLCHFSLAFSLCLFGDQRQGCYYPCRCYANNQTGCDEDTGECPTGECWQGKISGFPWYGQGCQVGNIAYGKNASSNSLTLQQAKDAGYNQPAKWWNPQKALDGGRSKSYNGGNCAILFTSSVEKMAWFQVDLGDMYSVYAVSLMNVNGGDGDYLETFDVKVGATSDIDDQTLCYRYVPRVAKGNYLKKNCTSGPLSGRYVTIKKYRERYTKGRLPLCEVIVTGHLSSERISWDNCVNRSTSDIFCTQCAPGWKPPICAEKCGNATYGQHCQKICENCHDSDCHPVSGNCQQGCALWHLNPDACDVYIPKVSVMEKPLVLFVNTTWLVLDVSLSHVISQDLMPYYTYNVYYINANNPNDDFQPHKSIETPEQSSANTKLRITVRSLKPHTQYWFKVSVTRNHKNVKDTSDFSPSVKTMTLNGPSLDTAVGSYTTGNSEKEGMSKGLETFIVILAVALIVGLIIVAAVFLLPFVRKKMATRKSSGNYDINQMHSNGRHNWHDTSTQINPAFDEGKYNMDLDEENGNYANVPDKYVLLQES